MVLVVLPYAMPIPAPGSACSATNVTSLHLPQLCEKEDEEEELAERSEHDSGINEEPLLTAEQVPTPKHLDVSITPGSHCSGHKKAKYTCFGTL